MKKHATLFALLFSALLVAAAGCAGTAAWGGDGNPSPGDPETVTGTRAILSGIGGMICGFQGANRGASKAWVYDICISGYDLEDMALLARQTIPETELGAHAAMGEGRVEESAVQYIRAYFVACGFNKYREGITWGELQAVCLIPDRDDAMATGKKIYREALRRQGATESDA